MLWAASWSCLAHAEPYGQGKRFGLSVYGGYDLAMNSSSGVGGVHSAVGLAFGFGGEYRLLPKWSLAMDILYLEKNMSTVSGGITSQYNLAYLEIPFFLKFQPSGGFALKAGPYLASLILRANKQSQGVQTQDRSDWSDDYGLALSAWFGFNPSPKLSVGLDMRYDLGLANIDADNDPTHIIKTRAIVWMGTLTFHFK